MSAEPLQAEKETGLFFFNTATRSRERFQPAEPKHVRLYACGPTVYDYFHVGNARAFVVFDVLRRVLVRRGYRVTYVQNITDIDDKIIQRAREQARSPRAVAEEYTAAFAADLQALGCLPADITPKATEHIPDILSFITRLIDAGHAYVLDGDVYFEVRSFPKYGRLSGKNIEELEEGARVEVNVRKRDPLDFALWKAAKPGEPAWDSPWGQGRPGWHIECSAMSMKYLGESFDIHGGGADLVFPHHENENAQSESLTGKPLARTWLHNGYLNIEGEKMSKSLGNFWLTRDVLRTVPYQVLRLFLLSAHYRSPLDFSRENLDSVRQGYEELHRVLQFAGQILNRPETSTGSEDQEAKVLDMLRLQALRQFDRFLDDDLNTAGALGQIYTLANGVKRVIASKHLPRSRALAGALRSSQRALTDMLEVLGVRADIPALGAETQKLLQQRQAARDRKDWQEADRIRDRLISGGWVLEDTAWGTLASHPPLPLVAQDRQEHP